MTKLSLYCKLFHDFGFVWGLGPVKIISLILTRANRYWERGGGGVRGESGRSPRKKHLTTHKQNNTIRCKTLNVSSQQQKDNHIKIKTIAVKWPKGKGSHDLSSDHNVNAILILTKHARSFNPSCWSESTLSALLLVIRLMIPAIRI